MKISLKRIVFELCIIMPLLYTFVYMVNNGNANKLIIIDLILTYILLILNLAKRGKRNLFIILNGGVVSYAMYTSIIIYPQYLMHSYFYTYLFAIVLFLLFSDEVIRREFYSYFLNAKNRFVLYSFLLFLLVAYTVIFQDGLRHTISMPVLYGPFEIPHYMSYILIVMYCGVYLQYKNADKKILPLMIRILLAVCIIWTAVRSTAIALAILIAYEFLSIKSFKKKFVLAAIVILIIIYLLLETNILINNPLMEKTMYAASNNGSITNNREWFRQAALMYYSNKIGIIGKLFGAGMPNLVKAILESVGAEIHAHNDYVNMLVGYGIVGLVAFIVSQLRLISIKKYTRQAIFLQIFIFVLAYYNGFALYTMLTSSMPIIILFFEHNE